MTGSLFHPAVAAWFSGRFEGPTAPQSAAWPEIASGRHTLIAAPTGAGKTLAAFLAALDGLVREGVATGALPDETRVVYVSPLRALSNDIQRNLDEPLSGITRAAAERGIAVPEIRTLVRTGDTGASARAAMTRRPPHVLVTTPESLYILLTSEGGRRMLATVRTVIVDEIHAVAATKRGSHLALSLERLTWLAGGRLQRIGLSATQRPVEEVARYLVGAGAVDESGRADCAIVDAGHRRQLDLELEVPDSPLEAVMSGEVWQEVYDRIATLVREHRTTLVFVNTRRIAERAARHLAERLGEDAVTSHHGSLSREQRLDAESRLKAGKLSALVATASLELGIDIGAVDLVCSVGSTRSVSTLLQRVGRAGHRLGATPKGRLFPTSRDELVECAALVDALRRDELEQLEIPVAPLDILAQQIVAAVAAEEWRIDELWAMVRRAWPYRALERAELDEVVHMLARGFATRRGRRGAWLHHDAVHGRLRARRGARLAALTSGGAIPENADYRVILEPDGIFVGTVDEDFAVESMAGDVFQLGNTSWRVRRVEQGRVLVEDAHGEPPSIPFWFGEAPARSDVASRAVDRLRGEVARRVQGALEPAVTWLEERGLRRPAAEQIAEYLAAARNALGVMPARDTLVLERFFDEAGNQHLVLHAPFGSRVNRAWGLALRKRFCRKFNFELQAAATEDSIVLSLGPTHSFPGEEVFQYLRSESVRDVLIQAMLDAPLFGVRWRWNATRALAVLRWRSGRKVPPRLQRMQAEDLVAVVFPDQLACLENLSGERDVPDHPLVRETIRDCLHEAMDLDGLIALLRELEAGRVRTEVRDLTEPSPLAHEVLNARPYAFLDDAPLEERRTQAVVARRWLDPAKADELGRLDPLAIAAVREEAWPVVQDRDELHDALVTHGFLTEEEGRAGPAAPARRAGGSGTGEGWDDLLDALIGEARATRLTTASGQVLWIAAERVQEALAALPGSRIVPAIQAVPPPGGEPTGRVEATVELLRGRLEALGPVTVPSLVEDAGQDVRAIEAALVALEGEGFAMRGRFSSPSPGEEWCDRRLLARIHRRTLDRLRSEIRPVAKTDFVRFLCDWQHVAPATRMEGAGAVEAVLDQLEGWVAPAAAWESEILAARVADYDPLWLDALCLSGRYVWLRPEPARGLQPQAGPVRSTPIALLRRERLSAWRQLATDRPPLELGTDATSVREWLSGRGASFFDEIVSGTGLLRTQVESALAQLVAQGAVTADSFTGLRALVTPASRRNGTGARGRRSGMPGMENAGRWSLIDRPADSAVAGGSVSAEVLEMTARRLLDRWGVVFRGIVVREALAPPWRLLLGVLRRLEARGEIRGGRFVDGVAGEQFALPEAVAALRAVRRRPTAGELVSLSAVDPLALGGVVLPGERVSQLAGNRILYRDGTLAGVLEAGEPRVLLEAGPTETWELRSALVQRRVPPRLKRRLGRSA